jgi:hypothetical protein
MDNYVIAMMKILQAQLYIHAQIYDKSPFLDVFTQSGTSVPVFNLLQSSRPPSHTELFVCLN